MVTVVGRIAPWGPHVGPLLDRCQEPWIEDHDKLKGSPLAGETLKRVY